MLRNLQGSIKNVDSQNKAAVAMKRGVFVNKDVANKLAILPTSTNDLFIVDRGLTDDMLVVMDGIVVSDYDAILETIKKDEFVNLIKPVVGERYAVDAYTGADADFAAGNFLTVSTTADATQGKLIASPSNARTKYKSLGFINDNGHILVGFECVE